MILMCLIYHGTMKGDWMQKGVANTKFLLISRNTTEYNPSAFTKSHKETRL